MTIWSFLMLLWSCSSKFQVRFRQGITHKRSVLQKCLYLIFKATKTGIKYFAWTDRQDKPLVQAELPSLMKHTNNLIWLVYLRSSKAAHISCSKPLAWYYTSMFCVYLKTRIQPKMLILAQLGWVETLCFTLCLSLHLRRANMYYKTSSKGLRYFCFIVILVAE